MRADANGDGVVTRDEVIADADRRFATMDTDGDGKLSRDESRAARPHRRVYGERGEQAPSDPLGDRFSGGEDARPPMTREAFRDRALRMFDRADTNHDGRIDAREMEAMRLLRRARMADGDRPRVTSPSDEQQ
ncbi:hypothetical protein [Sphingomonas sp. Mn802worker]|uniref:hypothetical protein n=1 Tax=Sphingomonas sp. Mn802worker TaxID=629773 RepID=UPI00138AB075|nr:hypothetical protein [Sphingomonas sp. Mn802worker]